MDPRLQSSFIPKKPIVATPTRAASSINLFSLVSTVLFIAAIAVSAGAFFYEKLLVKQVEANKQTLERAKGAFDPELIREIVRLDSRIETGKKLLSSHVAVTPLFDFLSSVTLRSVRFRDFSFTYGAQDKILVTMKGQAQSYAAVALQSDLLNSQKALKDTILSDMTLEPTGLVSFNVSTTVDRSVVSYNAGSTNAASTSTTPQQ